MADNLVYEESLNTEVEQSEFISKKWVYVNDNNSQNYTSQVVIDSTPLSNAGGWISWQEGYILMPLVVQLTGGTTATPSVPYPAGPLANYAWALKSGFWQMINSMTVEFNNQNVIQQTPFLNVFRSFKAASSWSQDDLKNEGSSTGFYPDNSNSWSFCNQFSTVGANPATPGNYYSNARGVNYPYTNNASSDISTSVLNFNPTTAFTATANLQNAISGPSLPITSVAGAPTFGTEAAGVSAVSYTGGGSASPLFEGTSNNGMLVRQRWNNYYSNATYFNSSLGQSLINNTNSCSTNYRTSMVQSIPGSTTWNVYAKLRLKDLADYFEQMPLLKGATMRFYINTNQTIVNFSVAQGTITNPADQTTPTAITYPQLSITNAPTVIGGLTCPLMIASAGFGQGCSPLPTGNYNLSVSIVKNTFSAQAAFGPQQTTLTACRLYAPVYTMNPLAESKYLSLAPTKKIMYKDIFQYQFNNVSTGNFNFLVSNGISNICSVLVVPFFGASTTFTPSTNIASTTGGDVGTTTNLPYSTLLSPLTTSGATPDPIMITNFNILVSGVNLFLNNENYDFEAFKQQLAYSNQLNGGLTTGLSSGLISEDDFSNLYRYYYGDCSRILPSEQGVSRSVQIVGNISSQASTGQQLGINLMVFVEFMKEMTIDISTGARIE